MEHWVVDFNMGTTNKHWQTSWLDKGRTEHDETLILNREEGNIKLKKRNKMCFKAQTETPLTTTCWCNYSFLHNLAQWFDECKMINYQPWPWFLWTPLHNMCDKDSLPYVDCINILIPLPETLHLKVRYGAHKGSTDRIVQHLLCNSSKCTSRPVGSFCVFFMSDTKLMWLHRLYATLFLQQTRAGNVSVSQVEQRNKRADFCTQPG